MQFTDSHCHLDFTEFSNKLPELLQQCLEQNIHRIIVPAVNPEHWQRVLSLTAQPDAKVDIACALGIHPWFLILQNDSKINTELAFQEQQLSQVISQNRDHIIAVGECGIDVFKAKKNTDYEQTFNENIRLQQTFFDMQLSLAKQNNLPVIVHHSQSHPLILPLLKQYKLDRAGVIHAFSGSYQQAKDYIDLGFKLGIGGTITYPRAKKTINAIKRLPLSSLLLETDAPAMLLMGQQGLVNSPLNLTKIFNALVALRAEPEEVISEQIEANVEQLFFRG
ncbi:MAG: hydrolase TatD [Gammaproteobacteria bacterium]|nr:MAG: hydrolase TatD [Gammaproteobacteria bacterium]